MVDHYIKATDFLTALEYTFTSADACHCHGPAKLSYHEVIIHSFNFGHPYRLRPFTQPAAGIGYAALIVS